MFRFTIRDMLWLTVVLALCVSWGLTYGRLRDACQKDVAKAQAVAEQLKTIVELRAEVRKLEIFHGAILDSQLRSILMNNGKVSHP